ncbi:MAG: amidohydrolase, partial [Planctomycetaceae bacterium]
MNHNTVMNRRDLLKSAGAGVAGLAAARPVLSAEKEDAMLIIDCHAHIYSEDEQRYPTIAEPYRPPAGKGTVPHLQHEMQAAGVRHVTAIQTSTFYRWDNRFTADSSHDNSEFMVGVVTLDPDDPGSPELLEKYVREFNVRGMRSIPAASGRLDDPGVDRLWSTAERLGIVINVLVNRDKRPEIESLAKRHPD